MFRELEEELSSDDFDYKTHWRLTEKNRRRLKVMWRWSKYRAKQFIEMGDTSRFRNLMMGNNDIGDQRKRMSKYTQEMKN